MPDMSKLWDQVIANWEEKLERAKKGMRIELVKCAFCKKFKRGSEEEQCKNCPIMIKTGEQFCDNTPYWQVVYLWKVDPPKLPEAVVEQLAWLKNLRAERGE